MNKILDKIVMLCAFILSFMAMFFTWVVTSSKAFYTVTIFDMFAVIFLTIKNGWLLIIICILCSLLHKKE